MKNFAASDVQNPDSDFPRIYLDNEYNLIDSPLPWQSLGLQETASGYGRKLTSRFKISFEGKQYRIYSICFSNASTEYFTARGKKIYLS